MVARMREMWRREVLQWRDRRAFEQRLVAEQYADAEDDSDADDMWQDNMGERTWPQI
jgi:glutaredoxin